MLVSAFRSMEPYLCDYGYGGDEIAELSRECLEEVRRFWLFAGAGVSRY
jgi:hypothetical protein